MALLNTLSLSPIFVGKTTMPNFDILSLLIRFLNKIINKNPELLNWLSIKFKMKSCQSRVVIKIINTIPELLNWLLIKFKNESYARLVYAASIGAGFNFLGCVCRYVFNIFQIHLYVYWHLCCPQLKVFWGK